MANMSIVSSRNEEITKDPKRIRLEQDVQIVAAVLCDSKYRICVVLVLDVSVIA